MQSLKKIHLTCLSFPGDSDGKEPACNAGDLGSISGLGRPPWEGNGNPLQYSCLENPHGQRSLAGYSPWGGKELDMTEHTAETSAPEQGEYSRDQRADGGGGERRVLTTGRVLEGTMKIWAFTTCEVGVKL